MRHSKIYIRCICCACAAILLSGIIVAAAIIHAGSGEKSIMLNEKILCAAQSVTDSKPDVTTLSVDIPPNVGITKIYASITQNPGMPIDGGSIVILEGTATFAFAFDKDPQATRGKYETTLVQPLCIGPEGAVILLSSSNSGVLVPAAALVLTVVYCPDYCTTE